MLKKTAILLLWLLPVSLPLEANTSAFHETLEILHVSALRRNVCVGVKPGRVWDSGTVVLLPYEMALEGGDIVDVTGGVVKYSGHDAIQAEGVELVRHVPLREAPHRKYADVRNGLLHARRIALSGFIADILHLPDGTTQFTLFYDRSKCRCRIPGRLPKHYAELGGVRVTGTVFNEYAADGTLVGNTLELEDTGDIVVVAPVSQLLKWSLGALCAVIAALLAILVAGFLKMRRERFEAGIIAKERTRIAADLHDTIEQHLAGVKMLLTAAMKPVGVPSETRAVLDQAAAMLIHAKGEVRETIMNFRAETANRDLAGMLREMANDLGRTGGFRLHLRLDATVDGIQGAKARDVALIVREAVTNAVKHGRAKNIAIIAENGVVSVLNDGEKFDPTAALGPETGHYGLAGMRERAERNGFALSFADKGRWCGVILSAINQ